VTLLIAFVVCIAVGSVLNVRLQRSIGRAVPPANTAELDLEAQEFLRTLDSNLDLPETDRAELRAELADHLSDSVARLEAEGQPRERAMREALARLGNPAELARQMNSAHRSARRALAGAAGGVFEVGVGAIQGYLVGLGLYGLVSLVTGVLLSTALRGAVDSAARFLPAISLGSTDMNTVFTASLGCFAALVGARRGVQATHRLSRRSISAISRWVGIGGGPLIAYLLMFVISQPQSWPAVSIELLIPIAFAFGALFAMRPLPLARVRVPGRLVAVAATVLIVAVVATGSWYSTGTVTASSSYDNGQQTAALNKIAPAWSGDIGLEGRWGTIGGSVVDESWQIQDPKVLSGLRDIRFELWRAVPVAGTPDSVQAWLPAPGYSAPYATEPADVSSATFTAHFDVGHVKTTRWLLLLTAVASDGIRYRVDWRSECPTSFSGTIWDWLTATY
jgi:uncharacterized membrane protein